MPNKNQNKYLDERDDFTAPSAKEDYPEYPKHVPIKNKDQAVEREG
ncbi:MAG TPA: hypothetical protein VEY51_06615 [Chondromyces sp.]|nr:hypothetical protein [Chondromyces sp.]